MTEFSRRDFIKGSAVGVVSFTGLSALAGCSQETKGVNKSNENGMTFADTIVWDGEYDVVIAGFGAAGAVAACYAADAGAKVLLIDKAPIGSEGGNSRFAGQIIQYSKDKDAMVTYFKSLAIGHEIDEDVVNVYAEGLTHTHDTLQNFFGVPEENFQYWKEDSSPQPFILLQVPEYPELAGSDKLEMLSVAHGVCDSALFKTYRKKVMEFSDSIDVWYSSPAVSLYQDPISKTIIGVGIDKNGKNVNVRAKNGVILTLGGFENNPQMIETFLGITKSAPSGTLFNTGDGIKLVTSVGADLWHMEAYEGNCFALGGVSFVVKPNQHAKSLNDIGCLSGSIVVVGTNGERYMREDIFNRHGHILMNGDWVNPKRPRSTYMIYDQAQADLIAARHGIPEECIDQVISKNTIAELAGALNMDPKALERTISDFNEMARNGKDPAYYRSAETMRAFSESGPYYAIEMVQSFINTQGGARRNARAEVIGVDGEPIPNLYSAGEFGGIVPYQYNGGGNMAECLIFGQIAGVNAAAVKDPLPPLPLNVESKLEFMPGSGSSDRDLDPSQVKLGENEYVGASKLCMGNELIVKVKMNGNTISSIDIVQSQETAGIGSKAVDTLPAKIIEAQSTDVDAVSGATRSSMAIKEAVEKAIAQAK